MLPVTSTLLLFAAASAASLQQASAQQCKDRKADELSLVQLRSQPILRQNHTLDVADSSTKDNYCIKITTGTSSSNDGTLAAKVIFPETVGQVSSIVVADGADNAKGSTVVEQCYSRPVRAVDVQNPTTNAWTGSIETSTDGGNTYAATICFFCTTGSDGGHVVVDGNADSANQAQTQCFNGQWCEFKGKYCIKITTGTSSSNDGTLAAKVTFPSGSDSIVVADGADYAKGSTVLEQCYSEAVVSVDVQNPTTNAWTGSIESSTDGGNTYAATICDGGCTAGSDGAQVVVDGNADSANQAPTQCFNGQWCTFEPQQATAVPTPDPTAAPTSSPTPSPTSAPTSSPTPGPTSAPTSAPTDSPTESPTESPTDEPTPEDPCSDGSCTIADDPHITIFDGGKQISLLQADSSADTKILYLLANLKNGDMADVWLVNGKAADGESVSIQARYMRDDSAPERQLFVKSIAVGGDFLKGNTLIIRPLQDNITWTTTEGNCSNILVEQVSKFNFEGLIKANRHTDAKLVEDSAIDNPGVDFELPKGLKLLVNRESHYVNVRITMPPLKDQDGLCGNYNGDSDDDTLEMIEERDPSVPDGKSLFPIA